MNKSTKRERTVGNVIYSVTPRGGIKSNKPSVVEMSIDHRFALQVADLFEDLKAGEDPSGDLLRLELHAVYVGDDEQSEEIEQKIIDIDDSLKEVTEENEKDGQDEKETTV